MLTALGMAGLADRRPEGLTDVQTLKGGARRFMVERKLLVIDEPLIGLDPQRVEFREELAGFTPRTR